MCKSLRKRRGQPPDFMGAYRLDTGNVDGYPKSHFPRLWVVALMLWSSVAALTVGEESRNWAIVAGVFAIIATGAASWEVYLTINDQRARRKEKERKANQRKQISLLLTEGRVLRNTFKPNNPMGNPRDVVDEWVTKSEKYIRENMSEADAVVFLDTSDDYLESGFVGFSYEENKLIIYVDGRLRRLGRLIH